MVDGMRRIAAESMALRDFEWMGGLVPRLGVDSGDRRQERGERQHVMAVVLRDGIQRFHPSSAYKVAPGLGYQVLGNGSLPDNPNSRRSAVCTRQSSQPCPQARRVRCSRSI